MPQKTLLKMAGFEPVTEIRDLKDDIIDHLKI